ncbi:MAG: hypothetical protein ACRDXB_20760, partial [Actinomycetes bacterium]
AELDVEPGDGPQGTTEAVAQWREIVESGDVDAQRTMIKRTFPRITLLRQQTRGDYSPERFLFDGLPDGAARRAGT